MGSPLRTASRHGRRPVRVPGAVVLSDGCFSFANLAYKEALAAHFTTDHVGHVLRIAGRWAEAIEYLKERCRWLGLSNVETVMGAVDDARFPHDQLDLVFMAWVFHHVDKPVPLLKSLMPSLKPWGVVVMVEPGLSHTEKLGRALTRNLVAREAAEAGFTECGLPKTSPSSSSWCRRIWLAA